jgi:hypothetical protein
MPNGTKWGVYAYTQPGTNPTSNTITGSGQITLVAPLGYNLLNLTSVSGFWQSNAVINGPTENPTKTYISIGLSSDDPQIHYSATAPTLLFTFQKQSSFCPDEFYLIENTVDPFDHLPNSVNSNPGNEITVLDFGTTPPSLYQYGKNIGLFAWDCHDCDGDGIPNALEDTNGNGVYDPGIDVSDLCNGSGGCVAITASNLHCEAGGVACGNNPSGPVSLVVDITGGEAPFKIEYTDGSSNFTLNGYESGTPFQVDATNGAVYSVVSVTGHDGCELDATNMAGEVPVHITGALQFTSQPTDAAVCYTESTSFQACAAATNGSFDIRWEYSDNQGGTWQPITFNTSIFSESNGAAGCKTLNVNDVTGLNGYLFRAIAEGTNLPAVISQPAKLSVLGLLLVQANPASVTVCEGETVVFNASFLNLGGGDIEYTWQLSHNNGATWWDGMPAPGTSGINENQLTISNIPALANGDIYRLRAQVGNCGFFYTQPALLTVKAPAEILAVLSPMSVCRGEQACFEVQATSADNAPLTYQWQERPVGSANWADIQGADAAAYCLPSSEGRNGYCYRAIVRAGNCADAFSAEACLTVEDRAVFAQQPQNIAVCAGETANFTASASIDAGYAGQVSYRWQSSADNGQSWQDLDNDTNITGAYGESLTIQDPSLVAGLKFRLSAATGICEASYSEAVGAAVEGPIEISQDPSDLTICPNSPAQFTALANVLGAGNLHLQWQASTDGLSWSNIAEGGNYTGTNTATLSIQNASNSRQYRLSAWTDRCGNVYSNAAILTVEEPILFSQQPESLAVCPDETVSFTAEVGGGNGQLSLQWQSSTDGQNWSDLADDSNYAGTQTTTLTIASAAGLDGTQFRLVVASQICVASSAAAVLSLESDAVCNPTPGFQDCVSLRVKKLDGNIGWSVWVKADESFTETPYQLPTSGKVTLVAPAGFAFQGLTSHNGGKWKTGKVFFNPPQDPGKVYVEFNLTPNHNPLELTPGSERLLFTFSVVNGCPSSLALMDSIVPAGFFPNQFTGFGGGLSAENVPFHFCGNNIQDTWLCPLSIAAPNGDNTIAVGQSLELQPSDVELDLGQTPAAVVAPANYFGVAPNPTRGIVTVAFDEKLAGKIAALRLWNLQGQLLLQELTDNEVTHRLDLGNTVPGIYFLTLEVDGKLLQREKIIVQ